LPRHAAYNKPKLLNQAKIDFSEKVMKRIDFWHTKQPCRGVRGLREILQKQDGLRAGRKLITRLMREMGICTIYPKPNLSKPGKGHKKFPYLLKNKAIDFPNQVWAVDITYIPIGKSHMYLTAVIDWRSRFIVGWELSDNLDTTGAISGLNQAFSRHGVPYIVNSDQGSQFTSAEYVKLLADKGVRQSMDGKARWVDNVIIERWFRTLKCEYIYINEYVSPRELRVGIAEFVRIYNTERPHTFHGGRTPAGFYNSFFEGANTAA
jgi:putative transposase